MKKKTKGKTAKFVVTALAATFLFSTHAYAESIVIQKGDTLSGIAKQYNTTVTELKSTNHLTSDTIYYGRTLQVPDEVTTTTETSTVHIVVSGDTLSQIGKTYGIDYHNIMKWNGLTSDRIYVGQRLSLVETSQPAPAPTTSSAPSTTVAPTPAPETASIIDVAKKYIGVPYKWAGTTPSGFDCSGFMYYILNQSGHTTSRTNVAGYWSRATKTSSPEVGQFVFFQGTYTAGPSHMGLYIGNGQFIHASSDGVEISNLGSSYYKSHFLGYGRLY
jgi:peptidoglycan endopeptidase LytE